MEPSEGTGLPEADRVTPEVQPDRLDYLEARVRELEERLPRTQLLDRRFLPRAFAVLGHYIVAGFILYVAMAILVISLSALPFGALSGLLGSGNPAVKKGPALKDVRKLPVNASGDGVIKGAPTGEAEYDDTEGSFVLVLSPAPSGLPARTTLDVTIDRSTKVFRDGKAKGNALEAMPAEDEGQVDADPTSAGTVVVHFHIQDQRVVADRLDLSDEFPAGIED